MNRRYSYPNISLWSPEAWSGREAAIQPLADDLMRLSQADMRTRAETGRFAGRMDGVYNRKLNARILPDVLDAWAQKDMICHYAGMGGAAWIALLPRDVRSDAAVLLSFHCADMTDPLWAMNALAFYEGHGEAAAANGFAFLCIVQSRAPAMGIYTDILLELSALWRLDMRRVYLDLSPFSDVGRTLCNVSALSEDFPAAEDLCGIPAVNITDRWQSRVAHQFIVGNLNRRNPAFDFERLIHSPLGRRMAEGMRMERDYARWDDPALLAKLEARGLRLEGHEACGERYLTAVPADASASLPLLICIKEVRPTSEFQALTALQFYSEHLEIAAAGDCMLLLFAMESPDDNELLCDILDEVQAAYPVDACRVYITGQSHNGHLALEFARRHPDRIAAIATLNDRHGLASPRYSVDSVPVTDEMLASLAAHDLPLINICGEIENIFPHTVSGTQAYHDAIDAFRRRLAAFRCSDRTKEEIEAALQSPDLATRKNGLPADRTEIVYTMGFSAYISDVKNINGAYHLRFVTLENLPHMISPQMAELSWSFLRRFARDQQTGTIVELDAREA